MGSDQVPTRRPLVEVVLRVGVYDADGSMTLFLTWRRRRISWIEQILLGLNAQINTAVSWAFVGEKAIRWRLENLWEEARWSRRARKTRIS
jgi:hypothetical protein